VSSVQTAGHVLENSLAGSAAGCVVGTLEQPVGIVTRARLSEEVAAGRAGTTAGALAAPITAHVYPAHGIDIVLDRLGRSGGLLPVVARESPHRVLGLVALDDVARFVETRGADPPPRRSPP
jgi:hypothetical protein